MAVEYSAETCRALREVFRDQRVLRGMRIGRYDVGQELSYEVTGVSPAGCAAVRLAVEKFVGGGFAGQVYRVKVTSIDGGQIAGLEAGEFYALKILIPPSDFALKFRNVIYKAGFQGDFSLQVNPSAARAGAIWQKFIRRGAKIRLGAERAVVDVLGTLFDQPMGACGEISEWIDGRNWRFEVDDRLGDRRRLRDGGQPDSDRTGSREYLAKRAFMAGLVDLMHEMGAPELARQYEWWTAKSQPNVLKRLDAGDDDPAAGLTAVDFRAGLALLPCLPMSPVDVKLICKGIARGSLVQFDRGSLDRLERFIDANAEHFEDMAEALEELKSAERVYRDSLPDVTHHHVRLLHDGRLWSGILDGAVQGWRARGLVDESAARRLGARRFLTIFFAAMGLAGPLAFVGGIGLVVWALAGGNLTWALGATAAVLAVPVPLAVGFARRLAGRSDLRRHYARALASREYLVRALRARAAETLADWHRAGRISSQRAMFLLDRPIKLFAQTILFSWMPAGLHRFLTDRRFAAGKLRYIFVRPGRLFFNPQAREQWLRDMVADGRKKHMLTGQDAEHILSRIKEPFIQKYLKSLAVHLCTLPITQVVSVAVAIWYKAANNLSWADAWGEMLLILAAFQVVPISPGSLARGLYVVYLVIRQRNIRDYNIAVFLSFFKYVGYLAFPIQMTYRYPVMARFMAAHWATEAVHVVPVFGEHGALLEHGVFDLFYNRPLTVRRRMRERAEIRGRLEPRAWHVAPIAIAAVVLLWATAAACRATWGALPTLWDIRLVAVLLPVLIGAAVTLGAGGAKLIVRVRLTMICSAVTALGYTAVHAALAYVPALGGAARDAAGVLKAVGQQTLWTVFLFTLLATVSALLTEIYLPEVKQCCRKK